MKKSNALVLCRTPWRPGWVSLNPWGVLLFPTFEWRGDRREKKVLYSWPLFCATWEMNILSWTWPLFLSFWEPAEPPATPHFLIFNRPLLYCTSFLFYTLLATTETKRKKSFIVLCPTGTSARFLTFILHFCLFHRITLLRGTPSLPDTCSKEGCP